MPSGGGLRQIPMATRVISKGVQSTVALLGCPAIGRVSFPLVGRDPCVAAISARARHPRDHERNLTLRWAALVVSAKLGGSSAAVLLKFLGQLPGYTDMCFGRHLGENLQRLQQAMRRLKVHIRFGPRDSALELSPTATAFHRNESPKIKGVGGQARADQRRD